MIVKNEFAYSFRTNAPSRSWRERFANKLRVWAQRIDGRETLGIEIISFPELSLIQKRQCILAGLKHAEVLVNQEVILERIDKMMPECVPDLYKD